MEPRSPLPPPGPQLALPSTVGKYEILSAIGRGGMATVHQARLHGPAGATKQVALKLIHPHLAQDKGFVLMFFDEMRVAMALSHRNIVQTFDAGRHEDSHYLVMELMDGGSLSGLLHRLPPGEQLPLDIALFVAAEVCAALDYAHQFRRGPGQEIGVVHRDVSPSNILLSRQGDVKLADFGVARAAGRLNVTVAGMTKGKLAYMAPEQASGQVEPRSDLFSVGAVLYALLTGVAARKDPTLESVRVGLSPVQKPSFHRPEVSGRLDALVARCLSKDSRDRPGHAQELRALLSDELERVQAEMGLGRDAHGRLRAFLAQHGEEEPQIDEKARRLAAAMLDAVQGVPRHRDRSSPGESVAEQQRTGLPPADEHGFTDDDLTTRVSPAARLASVGGTEVTPATRVASPEPEPALAPGATVEIPDASPGAIPADLQSEHLQPTEIWRTRRRRLVLLVAGLAALTLVAALVLSWGWRGTHRQPAKQPPAAAAAAHRPGGQMVQAPRIPVRDAGPAIGPDSRAVRAPRYGTLDLNAIPWAMVYVDGRYRGTTPLQGLRLPPGRRTVRLENPARGLSQSFVVDVVPGRKIRRAVRFPNPASSAPR